MMHSNPDQYVLDFTSRANERCSALLGLRVARLPVAITMGRLEGVIELLQRLVLLSRCLPDSLVDGFSVDAQVMAIASRIERRRSVSEKTVRNWTSDAKMLGLLTVDYASQQYGGCRWNTYTVHFDRVLQLLAGEAREGAGNGRKRPETISAPGAERITDPGAETVSAPNSVFPSVVTKDHSPPLAQLNEPTRGTLATARDEQPVVVSAPGKLLLVRTEASPRPREPVRGTLASDPDELELLGELEALDMSQDGARVAIARARARGLTHEQIRELIDRYREEAAANPQAAVSWLHRWLTGKSRPNSKARASPPVSAQSRGDGWSKEEVRREARRQSIFRIGRAEGVSEEVIRQRCLDAGVEF